jgi:hypothetical protein
MLMTLTTCRTKQKTGTTTGKGPRILITERTSSSLVLFHIDSATDVSAEIGNAMSKTWFISETQTKGPIIGEINSDFGKNGPAKKPYIRVWYNDSHGGANEAKQFEGPAIPKNENPSIWQDRCISPDEIRLPQGHPGYVLVFFNSCDADENSERWKNALAGRATRPDYLCWTEDTPGIANDVGVLFGKAVKQYFKLRQSANPSSKTLGNYVKDYIIDDYKTNNPGYLPILEERLKLK